MTNFEHPSESGPDQPDRPYSGLGPATQTYLQYIAAGRFDPLLSIEDLREIDSSFEKLFADIKSLVYECLSVHGVPPPLTGLPLELQLAVQVFTEQYFAELYYNVMPPQPPDTPQ